MTAQALQTVPPVSTAAEAEHLVSHLMDVMDSLRQVVQEETDLLRAGRVDTAARLEKSKSDLARVYAAAVARFKASYAFLVQNRPDGVAALQQRHESFNTLLKLNMTVLATARAVSEGIIRGVSGALARTAAPQTYGASGRALPTPKSSYRPLAVCRTL
jgi:hypothetical protein